jgi:hypothetical protein
VCVPRVTTDFGGNGGGVTPVPIPNTEVKPSRADGTWRETAWESRSPPDFAVEEGRLRAALFSFSAPVRARLRRHGWLPSLRK